MAKLLLISNGHGEDLSGSLLANQLQKKGHIVDAYPLVGKGKSYQKLGIKIHGFRREFTTGGIGYTSFIGRCTELIEGQLIYLFISFIHLFSIAKRYDLLIVVGDVIPVVAAWICKKKSVVYLVAYSSHYEGKLKLPWPSSLCLQSKRFLEIYSRDKLTSNDLSHQLKRSVRFLGNPFMDSVLLDKKELSKKSFRLGLLPGSRRPELEHNFLMILRVLKSLPSQILLDSNVSFDMALVDALGDEELFNLVAKHGWDFVNSTSQLNAVVVKQDRCKIQIHRNSFSEVLQSSDALLCMAGTAAEQAIGLGKPVIQLPGKGPQFTSSFAEAQRRLLGPTVFCAEKNSIPRSNIFVDTADLIVAISDRLNKNSDLQKACEKQASIRLGDKGGTQRIVESIDSLIT